MGAVYNQVFSTAKSDEFTEIVKLMNTPERLNSISVLKEFDPSHSDKYENVLKVTSK